MPNFDTCYKLWNRVAGSIPYVGGEYLPAWMDAPGEVRYDAHLYSTLDFLRPIMEAYSK